MNCMHRDEENKPGGGNDVEDDGNGVRSQWCWWRWRGSQRWLTVVMTVADSVCCSFSSSSSCRETPSVVVFFFFRLLLFGSSPFGLWWGWSCWWLLDGAVEVTGRWSCYGGRRWLFSSLCRGVSLCFLFFCWSILPSQWRRCGSGGEEDQRWFSFFFPSSSVTFFPHGSSMFFCVFLSLLPPVFIVSPSLFLFSPLTVSFPLLFFSFLLCSALRLWWRMAVAAGRRRWWADDGVGSAGVALSPPLFFPLSFPSGFPSPFLFFPPSFPFIVFLLLL